MANFQVFRVPVLVVFEAIAESEKEAYEYATSRHEFLWEADKDVVDVENLLSSEVPAGFMTGLVE